MYLCRLFDKQSGEMDVARDITAGEPEKPSAPKATAGAYDTRLQLGRNKGYAERHIVSDIVALSNSST